MTGTPARASDIDHDETCAPHLGLCGRAVEGKAQKSFTRVFSS